MTRAEYLAFERASREKHQYVRGEVFAMAGASLRHNALVSRLVRHLGNALDGRGRNPSRRGRGRGALSSSKEASTRGE
jgi:Uma2 family endonuclease